MDGLGLAFAALLSARQCPLGQVAGRPGNESLKRISPSEQARTPNGLTYLRSPTSRT
jgi:hypothetical protein